jgi:hypothetical protein
MSVNELIDRLDRFAVFLNPTLFPLRPNDEAQALLQDFREVEPHALGLIKQIGIDEKIDRPFPRRALIEHGSAPTYAQE